MEITPFFILGFGRSGTTLVASMLSMNTDIYIPPELKGLYSIQKTLKYFGDLTNEFNLKLLLSDLCSLHQMKQFDMKLNDDVFIDKLKNKSKNAKSIIEIFYETLLEASGKKRIGDKTIRHTPDLDIINRIFPDAKVIHIVRDGRDCALSHRKIASDYNVYLSAKRWKKYNEILLDFGEKNKERYLCLKYEDLLIKTKEIAKEICSFLDEPYSDDLLNYSKSDYAKSNTIFMSKQHTNLNKNIIKNNFNKWVTGLSSNEIKIFESVAGKMLMDFGYKTRNDFRGLYWRLLKFYFSLLKNYYDFKGKLYYFNFIIYISLKRILKVNNFRDLWRRLMIKG